MKKVTVVIGHLNWFCVGCRKRTGLLRVVKRSVDCLFVPEFWVSVCRARYGGQGGNVCEAHSNYWTQHIFAGRVVCLTVGGGNKQLATMILSGAEAVKIAVWKSKLTCLTPFLIFYL